MKGLPAKDVLVLKVGTSTLVRQRESGADEIDVASFERIGRQVDRVAQSGRGVVLVSSGARKRLPDVGWGGVVDAWGRAIGAPVTDFLLTEQELDTPNGCHNILTVACMGEIAVVNANDPVLPEDSCYRNNDIVAARLAGHMGQALLGQDVQLGILSDVGGVLASLDDPNSVIPIIKDLDAYRHLAGGAGSEGATGGMETKFQAARIAAEFGIETWVAHGRADNVVHDALQGRVGTHFVATR